MKTLSVLSAVALTWAALAQQPPVQAPAPGAAGLPGSSEQAKRLCAVEGHTVNEKTGEPLRRAKLMLLPAGGGSVMAGPRAAAAPYAATTDAEGKFRFENIEPGTYRLMAERQGFVRRAYGSRGNSMMGTSISLAPGQELKEIELKLTPQAVITGLVLDDVGEPLSQVAVQVLQRRFFRGKRQLMPRGGGQSDDTGEFRISGLAPGRYYLSATYRRMMFGPPTRNTSDEPEAEYVTTYYPGSTEPTAASAIDVQAGQELSGIDIRMQKSRVYRIRGKVTGGPGQSLRNLRLMVFPREREPGFFGMGGSAGLIKEDGSFEMGGVQPGSYYVAAMRTEGRPTIVGKAPVDVGQEDVEGVTLAIGRGVTLNGTVRIDAPKDELEAARAQGTRLAVDGIRIQLSPMEGMGFNAPNAATKEDGSFIVEGVGLDKYRIHAMNLPEGAYLKSIRSGDQEVLDSGIDLSAGGDRQVEITLGLGGGQIDGIVQDRQSQLAVGSMVTLIPDPPKTDRYDLNRMTTTDQNGRFALKGVPPGEYKMFAWEEVDPGAYSDPEFLKPHDSKAVKISVKEKSAQQVALVEIPVEETEPEDGR
ncbi:MAG: carboxypeptidase regulatory-like domain-containing protein [Bryobacteraceae bacterium]